MQDGGNAKTLNPPRYVSSGNGIHIEFGTSRRERDAGAENKVAAKTAKA